MRVLGRIRLSRSTEESTSVQRQRELIQNWATSNGHEIVGWAEDVDVSGSVSPFDAPQLGPYLKEPKLHEWDILCAWKLDRLARNAINMHRLFGWVQDNEKQLVCVSDNIDLSTWVGRLVASVIAGVAEGELEAIRERQLASKRKLRELGRWDGGRVPYGWEKAPLEHGGYKLEHCPETFPVLRRIIESFLAGDTGGKIASTLTNEGIATPLNHLRGKPGGTWNSQTVLRILESHTLLGWTTHKGAPVLGDDGVPIIKCPPAVTGDEWELIQERLNSRSWRRKKPASPSMLSGVVYCMDCGAMLYTASRNKESTSSYYCPEKCGAISSNMKQLHSMVDEFIQGELAEYPVQVKITTEATNHSEQLSQLTAAYNEITELISRTSSAAARQSLYQQLETLDTKIAQLEKDNSPQPRVRWESTSETYGDKWASSGPEEKRALLMQAGITIKSKQLTRGNTHSVGMFQTEFIIPPDLQQRLQDAGPLNS